MIEAPLLANGMIEGHTFVIAEWTDDGGDLAAPVPIAPFHRHLDAASDGGFPPRISRNSTTTSSGKFE